MIFKSALIDIRNSSSFNILFLLLYLIAFACVIRLNLNWETTFLLAGGVIAIGFALMALVDDYNLSPFKIAYPKKELVLALLWYLLYFLFNLATTEKGIQLLGNLQTLLALLVFPFMGVMLLTWKKAQLKELLNSTGFTLKNFKSAITIGVLTAVALAPFAVFSSDYSHRIATLNVFSHPLTGLMHFALAFVFALVLIALPEEFFFRGFLQSRIAKVMNSEWKALLITSLLFGLYHFPNLYLNASMPTHGQLIASLIISLTEQGFSGILFGILWYKTRNLYSCIFLHSFIDAIAFLPGFPVIHNDIA